MRIVLADPLSYTRPYDHELAGALARRGHEVDLITSRFLHGAAPVPEGYRLDELFLPLSGRLLRGRPRSRLRFALKGAEYGPSVIRFLRRTEALDPAVVHLQWLPVPNLDLRWLRFLAARRPLVFTAHDLASSGPPPAPVWRELLGLMSRVVVHSRRGVSNLAALGVDRARIVRVPHPAFRSSDSSAAGPPCGHTVLFFGLLRSYKGLDVLIRALPDLVRTVPETRLVVAGDPVDPVEPIRALATELGVQDRIEWRLGFLPASEVAELMAAAALVALPYRALDSSGVLATAIGHGRPVVVSDVGSLGELVREFDAGLVVPPEDVAALASACSALLTAPERLQEAAAGARTAAAALTWEAASAEHERLYREIASAR